MKKVKDERVMTVSETMQNIKRRHRLSWFEFSIGLVNTLILLSAIWFQISWFLIVVAALLFLQSLISIKLRSWYHAHAIMRSVRWLFVGEYPTEETLHTSMLGLVGFVTEDYKTFIYTFRNNPAGKIYLFTRSRRLEWDFPDEEACHIEMMNVVSSLDSAGLIAPLLQIQDYKEVLEREQKTRA